MMPSHAMPALMENTEFVMLRRNYDEIAYIMMKEVGISLGEGKENLVYSRLAKRLRLLGLHSFDEYCALVKSSNGEGERQTMIAALTTNVTRFFREPHHFEHLKKHVFPHILAAIKQGRRVRLWSAACSSGQEPYSMALILLSVIPDALKYDVRILATDIDPNMLAVGEAGIYDAAALEAVPAPMRSRWFTATDASKSSFRIAEEVRALVKFRKLNLIGNWPMQVDFHAIFCRNVVIYFEIATQEKIWSRLLPLLEPCGALYIGHSERVSGPAEPSLRSDGVTIYRPVAYKGVAA